MLDLILSLQAQQTPRASTVLQGVLLGIVILFIISVIATGFVARRIENIHNPTYSKAFLATILKNIISWAGIAVVIFYLQLPPLAGFIAVATVVPILVYKLVFASMWREAALIWVIVLTLEIGSAYVLTVAGIVSLAAVTA